MTKLISTHDGINVLLCPCGNDYSHIKKVESGNSSYNKEDTDLSFEAECESGHRFRVSFEQRKGNTHVTAILLEPPA